MSGENMGNILKLEDCDIYFELEREKKLTELRELNIGSSKKVYSIRGLYYGDTISIIVDKDFIKEQGEKQVEKIIFPYFKVKFSHRYKAFNEKKLEIGYFKNDRRVKFRNFVI